MLSFLPAFEAVHRKKCHHIYDDKRHVLLRFFKTLTPSVCALQSLFRCLQALAGYLTAAGENTRPASDTHLVRDRMSPPKPFLVSGSSAPFVRSLSGTWMVPIALPPSLSGNTMFCFTDARLLRASKSKDSRLPMYFNGGILWVSRCRRPKRLVYSVQLLHVAKKDSALDMCPITSAHSLRLNQRAAQPIFSINPKHSAHVKWFIYLERVLAKCVLRHEINTYDEAE